MSKVIEPTVGRVVWYHPGTHDGSMGNMGMVGGDPMAAIVVYV
jgi:hypothetical protein